MTIHFKVNDTWAPVARVYRQDTSGVWKPVKKVWRRNATSWVLAHNYDVVPPNPPEISLQLIDNRYIKVGVRIPGATAGGLKKIRLLVSRTAQPATQFGSGFISSVDNTYDFEEWSEFYYNGSNPRGSGDAKNHLDSSVYVYKQYPVNPTDTTNLPGNQKYYFSAWALDVNGNWSVGEFASIFKPKDSVAVDAVITKEARFQANFAGTAGLNGANYVEGELIQQQSPRQNGLFFYGNQIIDAIGAQGSVVIKSAQIRLTRSNDNGQPAANVNLFWHGTQNPDAMPLLDSGHMQMVTVGTISKGETKWFDLPQSHYGDLKNNIKGYGLSFGIQATDYLVSPALVNDLRNGELHVVWEESL